jgi:hypothetical protein
MESCSTDTPGLHNVVPRLSPGADPVCLERLAEECRQLANH